ncbi:uncharacterized protein LOC116192580 [Punica granatum]|uniref:C2 domain-containing protein n=2 Tax=Punica granatum TaxID=22663 RepID=A0A218VT67_PUNGR|nr:uncharacterized protein LOC116192580 [Punica granatum]OWM63280.1 hypothetical protein CDL15_Pgr022025 [Punica granatum]PKI43729.1 hypothetical protein CRG98_035876 [Punica granatum]
MSILLNPFQLLELNIISAQDLAPVTRSMRTYAVAWVHPDRKLSTRVDASGHTNPSWNDKFVFRVDDEFLESDTSAIMIEIYAVHWFKDVQVGTVRVLIDNVVPILPTGRPFWHQRYVGMEFVALQVRRPSGRPQGMLNIGVAVLDSSMRSMPLYSQLSSSAIGFKDLLDKPDPQHHRTNQNPTSKQQQKKKKQEATRKAELRRTKSDSSSMVSSNNSKTMKRKVSFHDKVSSVVNGSEVGLRSEVKKNGTSSKACSTVSSLKPGSQVGLRAKRLDDAVGGLTFRRKGKDGPKPITKKQGSSVREAPRRKLPKDVCMTDSELGPSPSEVAAEMAAKEKNKPDDVESSVLGGAAWSVADSVEGLQSKLERWRAELPPTQDACSEVPSSIAPSVNKDGRGGRRHRRRRRNSRRDGGDREGEGLFSCFSNICGCECSITCGNPLKKRSGKRGRRRSRSPAGSSTYV